MNSSAHFDNNNYLLLEENNKIPQNILNDLKKNNLEPLETSKILMNNYWISNIFSFILCKNIIDNKTYFYIFDKNNEIIDIILNQYEENNNINSKYYCYFIYNNIGYYIIHHIFVFFNQFIIHTDTKENFDKENKEELINLLLNTFKLH